MKFSLASCLMCACKRGHVKVVELLVQEEAVLLDVKSKNGLKPEEVTQDNAIRELLREEHWRRARSEVVNCPTQLICITDLYLSTSKYQRHSRVLNLLIYTRITCSPTLTGQCQG